MDAATGAPDGLVIGQDDESEIRVQPVTQGGLRRLDIRIWRRGPSGLSPTRDALMLDRSDMESLRRGIIELLEASDGGRQVARIVIDSADGRRLRAETEPFGTRYMAHLGFWQRARNTWRPDGDGISLSADRLAPLQGVLVRYEPWLGDKPPEDPPSPPPPASPSEGEPWPMPGADWLTVERHRIAFHPRGVRLTLAVEEGDDGHRLSIRQWRREDTLWVPEPVSLELAAAEVGSLLTCLRGMLSRDDASEEIPCSDRFKLRLVIHDESLEIDQRARAANGDWGAFEQRVKIPAIHLPRFGRALAQSAMLLTSSLSEAERQRLQEINLDELEVELDPLTNGNPAAEPSSVPHTPRTVGPVVRFGEDSEYPGAVIPQEGQIRIIVEGYLLPQGITLPIEVVARVVTGLEELFALQISTPHIGPMLLCDRPDCAVYGRIGTTTRPEAVELRVWTSPRDSDAVTFDRAYLGELIDGLRHGLRALGQAEPLPAASFLTVQRTVEQPPPPPEVEEEPPAPVAASSTRIGDVQMGDHLLTLALSDQEGDRSLSIQWDGRSLALPLDRLEELITDIRSLYYAALRGRRGQVLTVGAAQPIDIGIHHRGSALHLQLSTANDSESACLSFPIADIPAFLDAAGGALQYTARIEEG